MAGEEGRARGTRNEEDQDQDEDEGWDRQATRGVTATATSGVTAVAQDIETAARGSQVQFRKTENTRGSTKKQREKGRRKNARNKAKDDDDDGESWYGVTDPKKRKQIQDRLAQRARRKRIASLTSTSASSSSSPPSSTSLIPSKTTSTSTSTSTSDPEPPSHDPVIARSPNTRNTFPLPSDQIHLHPSQASITVLSALLNNGLLLSIPCATSSVSLSPVLSAQSAYSIPSALHPTALQIAVPHFSFIDRFPFACLRDRMIARCDLWSAEIFLAELFHCRTWLVDGCPWEPRNWTVDLAWRRRWAVLFDE